VRGFDSLVQFAGFGRGLVWMQRFRKVWVARLLSI